MANGDNFNDTVANGVLGAVNILTQKALSDLKFDKTYSPCTIISRSDADKNVYTCEYEGTRFEAYSEQSFFPDELVQVLVPQNNWDNQKRIISRVMTGNSAAYNFKYPFDDFIVVSALEVEDLYTLLAGCAPVFRSDIEALPPGEIRLFLADYYRYLATEDQMYVWGTTPFEIEQQVKIELDKRFAIIQAHGQALTAFPNKDVIYDNLDPEDAVLYDAIFNDAEHTFYSYNDLMTLINNLGNDIKSGYDSYNAYITARARITSDDSLTEEERVQRLFVFDESYPDSTKYYRYQTYEEVESVLRFLSNSQKKLSNLQSVQYSTWLGDTFTNAEEVVEEQTNIRSQLLAYWPVGVSYSLQQLVAIGDVPPNVVEEEMRAAYVILLQQAKELVQYQCIYYYVDGNECVTMYNQASEIYRLTSFIDNLSTAWLSLNTKIFDWTELSRDINYEDCMAYMQNHSNLTQDDLEEYINAWVEYKKRAFRGRSFKEVYLEYRITPICGGYDASYAFWANRRFEDKLTKHYDKIYTKLCSFVPRNDAATIEGFTKAGLQLDISSYLNEFNIIKGEYGVKILVEGTRRTTTSPSNTSLTAAQYEKAIAELQAQYETDIARIEEENAEDGYAKQKALLKLEARYEPLFAKLKENIVDTETNEYGVMNTDIGMVFDDEFTSKDFYGNAYAYTVPYSQQKLLNIEDFVSISRINLYVWQTLNTYDANGTLILGWERNDGSAVPYKYTSPMANEILSSLITNTENDDINSEYETALPQNLIIEKPYLGLGFAVQELANGKLILYTEQPLEYNVGSLDLDSSEEKRTLKTIWVKAEPDGSINIYPSWEMDTTTGELIELQSHERGLFYTRDSAKVFNDLVAAYKKMYNIPFDSTRARKQQEIIDMITRWINYERIALTRERERIRQHIADATARAEMIPYEIEKLNEAMVSLEAELAMVKSVADMSLLTNTALYTQREIDEARLELTTILTKIIDIDNIHAEDALTLARLKWLEETFIPELYDKEPAEGDDTDYKHLTDVDITQHLEEWLPVRIENIYDDSTFTSEHFISLDAETKVLLISALWTYYRLHQKTIELSQIDQGPAVTPETAPAIQQELQRETRYRGTAVVFLPKNAQPYISKTTIDSILREVSRAVGGGMIRWV